LDTVKFMNSYEIDALRTHLATAELSPDARACVDALFAGLADEREHARHAHALLTSESLMWLMAGADHVHSQLEGLRPCYYTYTEKYGSYARPSEAEWAETRYRVEQSHKENHTPEYLSVHPYWNMLCEWCRTAPSAADLTGPSAWSKMTGPVLTDEEAAQILGISTGELSERVATFAVLAIQTSEGTFVYPEFQFEAGQVVPGLSGILGAVVPLTDSWDLLSFLRIWRTPGIDQNVMSHLSEHGYDEHISQLVARASEIHTRRTALATSVHSI
jgi:hypothetical protein